MGQNLRNWRVVAASTFAIALVSISYVVARGDLFSPVAQASSESALLQAIATKDTDGDGLPDWQEALYGTDPHKTDSRGLGMTDGEAVAKGLIVPKAIADVPAPSTDSSGGDTTALLAAQGLTPATENTLTDAFSKSFFALYLTAKQNNGGADLNADQVNAIADQAVTSLSQTVSASSDFRKKEDLLVQGTGIDAMKSYAAAAEAVLVQNKSDSTKGDLEYFDDVLERNDTDAAAHLVNLAKSYRDTAVGLAALPVPQEVVDTHLQIVNNLMRLSGIYSDFAHANTDSLTAMLALKQYQLIEVAIEKSFVDLASTYASKGVLLQTGTPGASYVNLMVYLTAAQHPAP